MKKHIKKAISFATAAIMIGSMSIGLNATDAFASSAANPNADRKKVTIVYSQYSTGVDNPGMWSNDPIKAYIEDSVNVTLDWKSGVDNYWTALEAALIGGNAPDLFANTGGQETTAKWINDNLLTDIGEIINSDQDRYPILHKIINSPTYKMFNDYYAGDESKTYAIYALYAGRSWAGAPVYNKELLELAGFKEAPETVEEFVDFCNTLADMGYIGWWPRNNKLANNAGLNEIDKTLAAPEGASIMAPAGNPWTGFMPVDPDDLEGEWRLMTTSDESKAVIKQLAELYESGGLDNTIGNKDDFTTAIDDFVAGKIGAVNFGFSNYGQYDWIVTDKWLAGNPDGNWDDLVLGTTLTGSADRSVTYNASYWMGYNWVIPQTCKNPDRVLDLLEWIASSEGQSTIFNGLEGMYEEDADGNIIRDPAEWADIRAIYNIVDERTQYQWFSYIFAASQQRIDLETSDDWYEASMNPVVIDRYPEGDQKDYGTGVLATYGLDSFGELPAYFNIISFPEEINVKRTELVDVTLRYVADFITGNKDVDKQWDEYVKAYADKGADEIEDTFNKAVITAKKAFESY